MSSTSSRPSSSSASRGSTARSIGLFRYCVLTQDATYLCNKLDLQSVPQPAYPFFHVKMEDVWVWDKNRPTRMIPRVEVYTSSDVTVEELKGDGDEEPDAHRRRAREAHERPRDRRRRLAPAARARPRCCSRSTSATRRPSSGSSTATRLTDQFRVGTDRRTPPTSSAVMLRGLRRARRARRDRALDDVPQLAARVRVLRGALGGRRPARARAGRVDRRADPLRRPARGRPRPDRERGRGARALRRAGDRRRLRHVDQLRRRSRRPASTSAAFSRRASRSRWTRCSRAPRG